MKQPSEWRIGMVYVMTNEARNQVVALTRGAGGKLTFQQIIETGGAGTGTQIVDPLGSQGALLVSGDGRFLLCVNAGDNTVSCFRVRGDGSLALSNVAPSGGVLPVSLEELKRVVYVANKGDDENPSNLAVLRISDEGALTPVSDATRLLSEPTAQPACVVVEPCGDWLVVSEMSTHRLSVFRLTPEGLPLEGVVNPSHGASPFGMAALCQDMLLVSEAGPSALSSYRVNQDGSLTVIDGSVPNNQSATCWVVASQSWRFAYTANAGNNTLTYYFVVKDGSLMVIDNVPSNPAGTASPTDTAIDLCERNVYTLNGNEGSITVFRVERDGRLVRQQIFRDEQIPTIGAQGLAVL